MLIISKRVVPRLADLKPSEVCDLFSSVQSVGRVIEKAYRAESLNIAVQVGGVHISVYTRQRADHQDGAAAGQSVPHVHVHIIPRTTRDFGDEPDRVYPLLEQSEAELRSDLKDQAEGKTPVNIKDHAVPQPVESEDHGHDTPETHREAAITSARRKRETEGWQVPRDEDRKPRSQEEMQKEADWLRRLIDENALPN